MYRVVRRFQVRGIGPFKLRTGAQSAIYFGTKIFHQMVHLLTKDLVGELLDGWRWQKAWLHDQPVIRTCPLVAQFVHLPFHFESSHEARIAGFEPDGPLRRVFHHVEEGVEAPLEEHERPTAGLQDLFVPVLVGLELRIQDVPEDIVAILVVQKNVEQPVCLHGNFNGTFGDVMPVFYSDARDGLLGIDFRCCHTRSHLRASRPRASLPFPTVRRVCEPRIPERACLHLSLPRMCVRLSLFGRASLSGSPT
mmetsp:Transcript_1577/g.9719  ORF Transcript_1577/g.9719 Transcript_1577/m.9719 type:complete len:251 (-) Transcript_1577:902-1654(-)